MRKWTIDTIKQAPRQLMWIIVAFLLSGGAGIVGYLESIPVYLYAPLIAATLAFLLMAIHYIFQFIDSNRQGKRGISVENLEETLSKWLIDGGFSVKKTNANGTYFNLSAQDTAGRQIDVMRLQSDPDRIYIYQGYTLSDEQLQARSRLPHDVYSEIAEDMRIDIAAFDIQIVTFPAGQGINKPKDDPLYVNSFYLSDRVDFKHLFDAEEFYQRISFVKRATSVVSEYLMRMLRVAERHSVI